jgi:hypothetical protein
MAAPRPLPSDIRREGSGRVGVPGLSCRRSRRSRASTSWRSSRPGPRTCRLGAGRAACCGRASRGRTRCDGRRVRPGDMRSDQVDITGAIGLSYATSTRRQGDPLVICHGAPPNQHMGPARSIDPSATARLFFVAKRWRALGLPRRARSNGCADGRLYEESSSSLGQDPSRQPSAPRRCRGLWAAPCAPRRRACGRRWRGASRWCAWSGTRIGRWLGSSCRRRPSGRHAVPAA